jgi:hypothetical protein
MQSDTLSSAGRTWTEAIVLGSHILYADKRMAIISIENSASSYFWSDGTDWCTSETSCFNDYRSLGPLVFIKSFADGRRYLLSAANCEFRNGRNRRLSLSAFLDRFPNARVPITNAMKDDWRARIYFNLVPEGTVVEQCINLRYLDVDRLPDGLHIRDDLILSNNPIYKLPLSLYVGGDLVIRHTDIHEIPDGVVVMGRILR